MRRDRALRNPRPAPPGGPAGRSRRGAEAESIAVGHLAAHGLDILARNYRCRGGEIDIVARDGGSLIFVEVRLRTDGRYGGAIESIDFHKRRRIIQAARAYLRSCPDQACRFDVVLLDSLDAPAPQWIRDAFTAD